MSRQQFYCQCKLRRLLQSKREPDSWTECSVYGGPTYEVIVSWIPADKAKVGNKVRLKQFRTDEWSEGWEVMWVGSKLEGDRVEAAFPDWKHQRSQSDV